MRARQRQSKALRASLAHLYDVHMMSNACWSLALTSDIGLLGPSVATRKNPQGLDYAVSTNVSFDFV